MANGAEGAGDEAAVSSSLAKWLIPSAAVMFGVIGYVVQSGQESLLGVEISQHDGASYFNSAADFVRDGVIQLLSWPASWPKDLFLQRPRLLVFTLLAIVGACFAASRVKAKGGSKDRAALAVAAIALLLVTGVKFVMLDAPLLKIQNLVSSSDNSCWALVVQDNRLPNECVEKAQAKWVDAVVWSEASEIAGKIVCSRIPGKSAALLPETISRSHACQHGSVVDNQAALADEFLCNLLIEGIILCGALIVLRRATHHFGATAVCLLVMFYAVSTPYAYGKIGATQLFDYGDARVSAALRNSYVSEDKSLVWDGPQQAEKDTKNGVTYGWLRGIILHRDEHGASILVMRASPCPAPLSGGSAPTMYQASSSFVENGQIFSFDEINKVDLLTWLVTHQVNCPSI